MRNLISKHTVLSLVLFSLAWTAFGQETTGWEFDHLQGKVKSYTEYSYDFDVSDNIDHDKFMRRFYRCRFDLDRMLRFADNIKTERDHKSCVLKEFDSLGYFTRWSFSSSNYNDETYYQNEYNNHGQLLRRIETDDIDPVDTISFLYDSLDRLVERRYKNYLFQWGYDSEGRMVEYRYSDILMDSVLILEKYDYDEDGVLRKKESFDNRRDGNRSGFCEYDSKGNVVFERTYNWGTFVPYSERTTSYQYDRNDSIIKEISRETRWVTSTIKDTVWNEIDSTGQVVERFGITTDHSKVKMESNSVRMISRNEEGFPVEEVFEIYDSIASKPRYTNKKHYDELGRVVEEVIEDVYNPMWKKVIKYHKDTGLSEHYAVYRGEECEFEHESLFFYDEKGNCIAHIQWMPKAQNLEYYFSVYRYEYYE